MRAAAYYRVSSSQQREARTIDSQRTAAHAAVAQRGWDLVAEFSDDGASARAGKLKGRPGFARLLDLVRARGCDVVLLVAFDRLTRSADLAEMGHILGTLQAAGVKVLTGGGEETDLSTFGGRVSALVRAQLAAEESEIKSDRNRRGRARVAAAGKPPCASPFGLEFVGGWRESPAAAIVREMFRRVAAGESARAVAADFRVREVPMSRRGTWCSGNVTRIIGSRIYDSGEWRANLGVVIRVPVLVGEEMAAAARATLAGGRLRGLRRTRHVYLLEGIARCGICQSPIRIQGCVAYRAGKAYRYAYYVCERRRNPDAKGRCSLRPIPVAPTDEALWRDLSGELAKPGIVAEALATRTGAATDDGRQALADLEEWRSKLSGLSGVEMEALRLHERGLLSPAALEARLGDLMRRRTLLERQIGAATEMARSAEAEQRLTRDLTAAVARWREQAGEAAPERRRVLVAGLCDAWTVTAEGTVKGVATIGPVARVLEISRAAGLAS